MVCEFNISINTYLFFTTNKRSYNELATFTSSVASATKINIQMTVHLKKNNCQVALLVNYCQVALLVASALDNNDSMDNLYCALLTKSKYIK